jgi:serine/threonine-protein kinase ULK/ATG1
MNEVVIKLIGNYSYQTTHCLGEGVAIKKVDLNTFTNDKYLENAIFSEIYLLKRFNHPNIVRFKDVLSSKNSLYIITEFCKHGDLKEVIKRKRFKDDEAF